MTDKPKRTVTRGFRGSVTADKPDFDGALDGQRNWRVLPWACSVRSYRSVRLLLNGGIGRLFWGGLPGSTRPKRL